jgi:hypothetical protein
MPKIVVIASLSGLGAIAARAIPNLQTCRAQLHQILAIDVGEVAQVGGLDAG